MIRRSFRAHAFGMSGDGVLLKAAAGAFLLSLVMMINIPPDAGDAPPAEQHVLATSLGAALVAYGAVFASLYGSFRYTVDRRDGVIAQRLMSQSRRATLLARATGSAIGGVLVALAGFFGGRIALAVGLGAVPMDWSGLGAALALGALAGLWGMAVGIVIQAHLVALFAASLSMSAALMVAVIWAAGAVYFPPLVMLEAFHVDVTAMGIAPDDRLDGSLAVAATAAWLGGALLTAAIVFTKRDVR